jgi:hypothetical protein
LSSATLDVADAATNLPKHRYQFSDVLLEYYRAPSGYPLVESFGFKFERWSLNHNPIPDDAVEVMLAVLARQLFPGTK